MVEGFVRVAAVTPEIKVGDCGYNASRIERAAREAAASGARIVCFPELSVTGYTCGDLFLQDTLIAGAKNALLRLVKESEGRGEIVVVGLPFSWSGKLYNVAAVYSDGILHALIPKTHIPNYGEFYELRHFAPAEDAPNNYVTFTAHYEREPGFDPSDPSRRAPDEFGAIPAGQGAQSEGLRGRDPDPEGYVFEDVPFGTQLLFECEDEPALVFSAELCEDLWVADPPSVRHAKAGARIILNLSAGNEAIGKASYRRLLVNSQSGRLICGYVYANAGFGESSTDLIFSGHSIISENGAILAESLPFGGSGHASSSAAFPMAREEGVRSASWPQGTAILLADIDLYGLDRDRRYMNSYRICDPSRMEYETVFFSQKPFSDAERGRKNGKVVSINKMKGCDASALLRRVAPHPFVPEDREERAERCEEILNMQSSGLAKRLSYTGSEAAIIGVSGGLDSTLALLASVRAARMAGKSPEAVVAVTMPGFGTTDTTKGNARKLCEALGVGLSEIDIRASAEEHLAAIGRSVSEHDVVFENAQARVRTLTLMDMANQRHGLVVGTGDLSELALGWSTYNGDHMSMYGVNAGVPKTLVRHIIRYVADTDASLTDVLNDILDTPVSPELLPPDEGGISQKTEEIIGPYELHDFFLYHMARRGRKPSVILDLAKIAFSGAARDDGAGRYDEETIRGWMKVFYRRFFANQFKRSALPDGPKIGSVSLSPRGDWRMPSDAEAGLWMKELE
ncbi:MAG: NAD(+) synthase [Clostridiales Family XIII bacterium]|jgi:NAD+ synthase (glutamine-hydrolysing)|nr:NAD(+) synthase [Clostridiales Family XIII bacterium]